MSDIKKERDFVPKNTPKEFEKVMLESLSENYHIDTYENKKAIDKAIERGKIFLFKCQVNDSDFSTMNFGKIGLIMVGVLLVLLLIFGDPLNDPLFLIVGLAPLFMIAIISYGYYHNGKDRVRNKPSWFIMVGPKGLVFRTSEYFDYIDYFQISKIAERIKSRRKIRIDIFGCSFIARQYQFNIDFFMYDLSSINQQDPIGKTGRENLMYIITKYKETD